MNLTVNEKTVKLFEELAKKIDNKSILYAKKGTRLIPKNKKGSGIHIKKENRGKFTEYCGGTVTQACISKGKNSPDPKIRKRATFAANARKWN